MRAEIINIQGGLATDDRGTLRFVNDFNFKNVKRFYQVENHEQGFVRAWHGHKNESKYIYVSRGAALVGIVSMETGEINKFVLSSNQPRILFIPPNNFNGFKTLEADTIVMFYSTSSLEESLLDDIREPFDKWDIWSQDFR